MNHHLQARRHLSAVPRFALLALDHVDRAFADDATPDQRRARIETAASDIASATYELGRAGYHLALAVVRS